MGRTSKRWTCAEDETLMMLRGNGFRNAEIGEKMGRTSVAIDNRLSVLGATPLSKRWTGREHRKLQALCAKRISTDEIAKFLDRSPHAVRVYAHKHKIERVKRVRKETIWTEALIGKAEGLWMGGASLNKLASELGISRGAASSFVHRLRKRGIVRDPAIGRANHRAGIARRWGGHTQAYKAPRIPKPKPTVDLIPQSVMDRAREDAKRRELLRQLIYRLEPDNSRLPGEPVYRPKFAGAAP